MKQKIYTLLWIMSWSCGVFSATIRIEPIKYDFSKTHIFKVAHLLEINQTTHSNTFIPFQYHDIKSFETHLERTISLDFGSDFLLESIGVAPIEYLSAIPFFDIEYEFQLLAPNQWIALNLNTDLFREPLVVNPSIGFSATSVLQQIDVSEESNFQCFVQPRVYIVNYETAAVIIENEVLMNLKETQQSLDVFAREINFGIIYNAPNFSVEYSRTTDFNEWGEIEISFQMN